MKIIGLFGLDIFRYSLGWALESLGHRVYYLNEVSRELLEDAIQMFQPDIYMDMGWDYHHYPSNNELVRDVLREHGIYHVYFAEEDSLHFENWSKHYTQLVSPQFVLTRSRPCIPLYEELGFKVNYLDVGCNPEFHRAVSPDPDFICDVSVVANGQFGFEIFRRKSIKDLVLPLFNQSFRTELWGRQWDEAYQHFGVSPQPYMVRGLLPFHKTPKVYSSTKINLSIQSMDEQISNRTYDIMANGSFLLTSNTSAVRDILQPGVNCEVSDSPEETLEKVSFYLANEDARQRIASAGRIHAMEHLSYQRTLPPLLSQIEQDLKATGRYSNV
ncbi:glycosyltransferase [Paenibacillus sp. SYP-B3998]|uniref:Glycosyltransferase n=1 Tax=Paenibacillus sp. SYP-B3998 TaxID=2678564 RepID=A0A6G3ZQE1_9BACL|nr:glycosyltransferase [Paenibacillus sp. SYP-B3998]NEW04426.1 glycosyltransferase [Paenibacillus sp. SYP-B3998]